MSPTPKQKVMALVKAHRAELIDSSAGDQLNVTVWSPPGQRWADGVGVHCLSAHATLGEYADAWLDLADRLAEGLEPCTLSDCDTCAEAGLICEHYTRHGRICGWRLDDKGQCGRASDHVESP